MYIPEKNTGKSKTVCCCVSSKSVSVSWDILADDMSSEYRYTRWEVTDLYAYITSPQGFLVTWSQEIYFCLLLTDYLIQLPGKKKINSTRYSICNWSLQHGILMMITDKCESRARTLSCFGLYAISQKTS